MALVAIARVVAGLGSAAVWVGGTMVGVVAVLVMLLGILYVWAIRASAQQQPYCLEVVEKFQSFLLDLLRGRGKK